ncbi:MAG TPA: glycogen/starch synthase, partial [Methanospirillum sp.]|uniref:glycogen/starch synthase n=1 Tax=Methanospirillum sp. TaxID=45200 RepID=UPI002C3A8147
MRVLMFGWEFPPHISGGLGTASYGLTKGMSSLEDLDVIFVVPKAWGDEDQTKVRLIGANKIPVAFKQIYYKGFRRPIEQIEISSKVIPYTDPEDYYKRVTREEVGHNILIQTNSKGMVDFSGRYDGSLLEEIYKYSVVASVIAAENEFDIIHAHGWLAYPAGI